MDRTVLLNLLQLHLNLYKVVYGNLVYNKPSTDLQGNDLDISTCLLSKNAPLPYWQVDLQGYYHIDDVTIITCWGSWGWRTQSVEIEGFFSDPKSCDRAEGFLFGSTPPDAGELKSFTFTSDVQFPVRYLRVSATLINELGLQEVKASGTPIQKKMDLLFSGENNKKVSNAKSTSTVSSPGDCSRICSNTDNCFAFSFIPDQEHNCLLSDCACVDDVPGWRTMKLNLREAFSVSPCAPRP